MMCKRSTRQVAEAEAEQSGTEPESCWRVGGWVSCGNNDGGRGSDDDNNDARGSSDSLKFSNHYNCVVLGSGRPARVRVVWRIQNENMLETLKHKD